MSGIPTINETRADAGPDEVREACYRLCDAMRMPSPWLPSIADLRTNLREAYVQRDALNETIAKAEAALQKLEPKP